MRLLLEILFKELYRTLTERNYREFLRLVLRFSSTSRYVQKKIKFMNYTFTVPDTLSFIWQFKEIFTDDSYLFSSHSRQPIIYDCGANIGTSVLYFKRMFPEAKVKAFEADPKILKILEQNISANKITNIETIGKAVWINDGGVEFSLEGADGSSIFGKKNKVKIASIRLKNFLDNEDRIDLLKMDIEGAEVEVIRDCNSSLKKAQHIFIEYHSFANDDQKLNELLQTLSHNGFRYFIKQEADRKLPFINTKNKNNPAMDMQLNIFASQNK